MQNITNIFEAFKRLADKLNLLQTDETEEPNISQLKVTLARRVNKMNIKHKSN